MLRPTIFESSRPLFFDRLFQDFFSNDLSFYQDCSTDVIDKGDSYLVQAELPGFQKEEINIDIENDTLTISANHKEAEKEKKTNYLRQERRYRSYCRSFNIPDIKKEDISAAYKNGVLEITLPKQSIEERQTKRIEIN